MRRCVRCIMPDTVPGITFDEKGLCSLCRGHTPNKLYGEDALRDLLSIRRPGKSGYDSVVPLSGGRDSTYVLYLAKKVYGLNPLAVNHDNEFRNFQAVKNMDNACKKLGVDLSVVRSKNDVSTRIVRANVKAAMPLGTAYLATSFCRQCSYGYHSSVYIEAERHGVPLILWGTSQAESTEKVRKKALSGLLQSKWTKLTDPNFYKTEYLSLRQRIEFPVPGNSLLSRGTPALKDPAIQEISVFDYIPWERQKLKETIARELGWEKPFGHVTTWRSDCTLHQVVNFFFVRTVGCTQDCMGYCNMINDDQMTRAEALEQEEQAIRQPWEEVEKFLREQIGLSSSEAKKINAVQKASPLQFA
jgi:hypothetical protein